MIAAKSNACAPRNGIVEKTALREVLAAGFRALPGGCQPAGGARLPGAQRLSLYMKLSNNEAW